MIEFYKSEVQVFMVENFIQTSEPLNTLSLKTVFKKPFTGAACNVYVIWKVLKIEIELEDEMVGKLCIINSVAVFRPVHSKVPAHEVHRKAN